MKKLSLKKELYWKLHSDGVSVYSYNSDLQKRIYTKEPQTFFTILKHLENPITLQDLYTQLPDFSPQYINQVVEFLKSKNYISTHTSPAKYQRINNFVSTIPDTSFNIKETELKSIKILIMGLGTVGSYQIDILKRLGICNFTIIDDDKVEEKNLSAQNYEENDTGQYKVDVIKRKNEDSTVHISSYKTHIYSYNHLKRLVNLNDYAYIINTMDDKTISIQLLKELFVEFPSSKLILNGYLIQKQMSYLVDKKNSDAFLKKLTKSLSSVNSNLEIVENSGSIFNSIFMALSTGKMIFDDIFKVRHTNYAYADFFMNDFFIGNLWEKNLYTSFSKTKKSLNRVTSPIVKHKWISNINEHNYLYKKYNYIPTLNSKEKKFLLSNTSTDNLILTKQMFNVLKHLLTKQKDIQFIDLQNQLLVFIKEKFGKQKAEEVKNYSSNNRIYLQKNRFDKEANLSFYNNGLPLIYVTETTSPTRKSILLIHEIFHTLLFPNSSSFDQEDKVLKLMVEFILKNKNSDSFISLAISFLTDEVILYMNSFISTTYEKLLLTNSLNKFSNLPLIEETSSTEIVQILKRDISTSHPFHCLKYVLSFEHNFSLLQNIYHLVIKNEVN